MTTDDPRILQAREAARSSFEAQLRASSAPRPPAPGDLYQFDVSSADGIEWLLLEVLHWPAPERCLLVPADLQPLVGSEDSRLPTDPCGPLSLRCGHAVNLDLGLVASARRTGVVSAPALAAATDLVERLRGGEKVGGAVTGEVDADLEYRDWLAEHVEPARLALLRADTSFTGAHQTVRAPETSGAPSSDSAATPAPRLSSGHGQSRWLALAASALISAGLAFSVAEWRHHAETPPGAASTEPAEVVLNPQLEWFQPQTDSLRAGAGHQVQLPAASDGRLVIVLETWSTEVYERYGVELWQVGTDEPEGGESASADEQLLWHSDQLSLQGASEIVIGLSAALLSPQAEYRFQLQGLGTNGATALESYRFRTTDQGDSSDQR